MSNKSASSSKSACDVIFPVTVVGLLIVTKLPVSAILESVIALAPLHLANWFAVPVPVTVPVPAPI